MGKAQIAIEFVLLTGMAFIILVVILISTTTISSERADEQTYLELRDYGNSLQRELILATEMNKGYHRIIDIPEKINGRDYIILTGSAEETGYIIIEYLDRSITFVTPKTEGEFTKGTNKITKQNGSIKINP